MGVQTNAKVSVRYISEIRKRFSLYYVNLAPRSCVVQITIYREMVREDFLARLVRILPARSRARQ